MPLLTPRLSWDPRSELCQCLQLSKELLYPLYASAVSGWKPPVHRGLRTKPPSPALQAPLGPRVSSWKTWPHESDQTRPSNTCSRHELVREERCCHLTRQLAQVLTKGAGNLASPASIPVTSAQCLKLFGRRFPHSGQHTASFPEPAHATRPKWNIEMGHGTDVPASTLTSGGGGIHSHWIVAGSKLWPPTPWVNSSQCQVWGQKENSCLLAKHLLIY